MTGESLNDAPFEGTVILAPCLGGVLVFVASSPYEPGVGSGVGIWFNAEAPEEKTFMAIAHTVRRPMTVARTPLPLLCRDFITIIWFP